jgi:SAM-dependent methyltransferase
MDRIPEPDLMDEPEQARAYADADFSEPHDAFVAHFRRLFPSFRGGAVLDLGCGPADIAIRFGRAYAGADLLGVDGAPAMLALGEKAVAAAGLASRIRLERRYLPDPALPQGAFDAVISNSLLHHLDDPAVLWDTVIQAAKPGAAVLAMDLMRPSSPEEAARLTEQYAAGAPAVLRHDFHQSLLAAYRPEEVRSQLVAAGLGHFQVEAVSDRHLLVWGTI